MNVGDQWSDLQGGFADTWTKIPNPTYFLASPDLGTAPTSDGSMVPPTSYVMQPDGSSGYSVATGDDIPNIDPVRKMIRGYYNADSSGIANKVDLALHHPAHLAGVHLDAAGDQQLHDQGHGVQRALAKQTAAAAKVAKDVRRLSRRRRRRSSTPRPRPPASAHTGSSTRRRRRSRRTRPRSPRSPCPAQPAVVFDADDTTLWTYDMEDGAMKFVFDPVLQGTWVTGHLFPATPGWPRW